LINNSVIPKILSILFQKVEFSIMGKSLSARVQFYL
jgi:hypothetical protein